MGISRLSVREGVKSLEAVGILEARQGEGIYVKAFTFDSIFENLPYGFVQGGRSLRHLLEVRTALEEGLIGMIVGCSTPHQIAELQRLTDLMLVKASSGETFAPEDRAFHRVLYAPLDNPFLDQLVELFWEVFRRLNADESVALWRLEQTVHDHQAIVTALRLRDGEAATTAMRRHFEAVRIRLESGCSEGAQPHSTSATPTSAEQPQGGLALPNLVADLGFRVT